MFDSSIPFTIIEQDNTDVQVFDARALLDESQSNSKELFLKAINDIKVIRKEYITVCACSFGRVNA
jgi:hypothetical protein